MLLAHKFQFANEKYATDYPANIGPHMTNTDSGPFMDLTSRDQPARKRSAARRSATAGIRIIISRPTCYSTFNDDDFRLGTECRADHAWRDRGTDRRQNRSSGC